MKICLISGSTGSLGKSVIDKLKNDYFLINIGRSKSIDVNENILIDFSNFNLDILKTQLDEILSNIVEVEEINFIHSAGIYEKEKEEIVFNKELLLKTFNVNTFSYFNIVNGLVQFWKSKNVGGSVVAISSNLTKLKNKNTASYISSKYALVGMSESFAQSFGSLNVRFNVVSPGMFPSELNGYSVPESFKQNSPLKRICEVEEISDLITFLISDKSKSITAQNIIIDGGNSNGY